MKKEKKKINIIWEKSQYMKKKINVKTTFSQYPTDIHVIRNSKSNHPIRTEVGGGSGGGRRGV